MRRSSDDNDNFDERGILKDGRTVRVPLHLRDSVQRGAVDEALVIVDGFGNGGLALHRPGARYAACGSHSIDNAVQTTLRCMRAEAYAAYDQQICDAWRGPLGSRQ